MDKTFSGDSDMTARNEFELRLATTQYKEFKFFIIAEYLVYMYPIFDEVIVTDPDIGVMHFKYEDKKLTQISQPIYASLTSKEFSNLELNITGSNLSTGCMVKLMNEDFMTVYRNTKHGDILQGTHYILQLVEFDDNLKHKSNKHFSVVELYDSKNLFDFHCFEKYSKLWEKKLTKEEKKEIYTVKNMGLESYVANLK